MQLLRMFHQLFWVSRLFGACKRVWQLLFLGVSIAVMGSLSACSQDVDDSRSTRRAIAQSQAIAADFLRTELALSPETASRLNLERYLGPSANFALDNHSQAGFERRRLVRIELLQRLQTRPRLPAGHPLTRDLEVAEQALSDIIALEQLGYGRFGYASLRPYAIDPFSGIWIDGPNLLAYRQSINSAEQAAAYLARMGALSSALQDTKRRIIADQASGIVIPRALVTETRNRLQRLLDDEDTGLNQLSDTFNALILNLDDLDTDRRARLSSLATLELDENLRPAYREMILTLENMSDATSDKPGIWAQPQGQELFTGIIKAALGESVNITRLHDGHLETVAAQRRALSQMMTIDPALGETVAEKPERLSLRFAWFEQTLPVQAAPISEPVTEPAPIDTLLALAPETAMLRVQSNPAFPAQADALRRFQSLLQTAPYQTWQAEGAGERTPYRQIVEYPAIEAAWQYYIWDQSIEPVPVGAEPDPMGVIGQASIDLIQSVLAAADTGIHLSRWTIAEATDYIAANAGLGEPLARELALTVAAKPGYHSAVAIARHRYKALSERAQAVLGTRYSESEFQYTLIEPGPRPLPLIEQDVEAWYGDRLAAQSSN